MQLDQLHDVAHTTTFLQKSGDSKAPARFYSEERTRLCCVEADTLVARKKFAQCACCCLLLFVVIVVVCCLLFVVPVVCCLLFVVFRKKNIFISDNINRIYTRRFRFCMSLASVRARSDASIELAARSVFGAAQQCRRQSRRCFERCYDDDASARDAVVDDVETGD